MEGNFANQYKYIIVHNLGTGVRWIGVIVVFFAKVKVSVCVLNIYFKHKRYKSDGPKKLKWA